MIKLDHVSWAISMLLRHLWPLWPFHALLKAFGVRYDVVMPYI